MCLSEFYRFGIGSNIYDMHFDGPFSETKSSYGLGFEILISKFGVQFNIRK